VARALAQRTSRRGALARLSAWLVGAAALPLLPIDRSFGQAGPPRPLEPAEGDAKSDPRSCDYWRYCAIDGFLCSCCGGTHEACPPGTEMSPVTWIGTCENPADGRRYVISYNDCCGHGPCGRCLCNENEGERPVYVTPRNNDILWCFGTRTTNYNCSVALVVALAARRAP
jgi:methylamine dehydrogenase light chain